MFAVADTHFFHARIIEFGRPFATIEEHNETIVANWNATVLPEDKIYVLGDCVFGGGENFKIFERLNGEKHLILGNHDTKKRAYYEPYFKTVEAYAEMRFHDGTILMSHMPVHPDQMAKRFAVNVHGHVHAKTLMAYARPGREWESEDERYFNVSLENINYRPILIDEIRRQRKARFVGQPEPGVD